MYHIYIDAEFDAVRINRKFYQMVISLGAVMVDQQGIQLDTFYALVKPYNFKRLTNVVKRMTKLHDDLILQAESLLCVEAQFKQWIASFVREKDMVTLYSFGPDDRRTITQNCLALHIDEEGLFARVVDLQKSLSATVSHQGRMISNTLSLDDMKAVYEIAGVVDHNALSDAIDLMKIHQAVLRNQQPSEQKIMEIVNRKIQKAAEVQEKQRKKLCMLMRQRFQQFPHLSVDVIFVPEVIEQFRLWEDRDEQFQIHWKKTSMYMEKQEYPYASLQMNMDVDIKDTVPYVTLVFMYEEEHYTKKYLLNYRNATMVENILRRLVGTRHGS